MFCEVTIQEEAQLCDGIVRYVFSLPEAVNEDKWKALLMTPSFNQGIEAVIVNAHCVESWGTGVEPIRRTYSQLACNWALVNYRQSIR